MAEKLTAQQIRSIVAAQKPGFEAEPADTGPEEYAAMADQAHVQTGAPDLQYLANKFLKTSQQAARPAAQRDSSAASNATKIVRVHPAGVPATDSPGTGNRKVVVVSAKEEKVVGEQG